MKIKKILLLLFFFGFNTSNRLICSFYLKMDFIVKDFLGNNNIYILQSQEGIFILNYLHIIYNTCMLMVIVGKCLWTFWLIQTNNLLIDIFSEGFALTMAGHKSDNIFQFAFATNGHRLGPNKTYNAPWK